MRVWSARSENDPLDLVGHTARVQAVEPLQGHRLASVSWDTTLRIWDLRDGSQVATLRGHDEWVEGCCEGPDGRLVTWSFDHSLRHWDPGLGEATQESSGHTDHIKSVMALPDGQLLSWSWDGTTRLWNPSNGKSISCRESHGPWVDRAGVLANGELSLGRAGEQVLPLEVDPEAGENTPVEGWQVHRDMWLEAAPRNLCSVHLPDEPALQWHCDGALRAWTASPDGTFSLTSSHQVLVLHIYDASQRIEPTGYRDE